MMQAKQRERWSLLGVSAPASVAVGMTLAEQSLVIAGPFAGAAAVALGVSGWFFEHRKPHRPAGNYLLSVETELESTQLAHRLAGGLKRLFSR
jgi:hypothetical protein